MRIELLPPRSPRIRKQNIHMIRRLLHLLNESVQFRNLRVIGRNGDGLRAGSLVGQGIEGRDGFIAGLGFARGDVDF